MFDVRVYGDPVLRKAAQIVTTFDASLKSFVEEMIETMREKDGVGLAAPQVGNSIRLAVIDASGGEQEPFVLINPEIYDLSEVEEEHEEGCLSVPGIDLKLTRPSVVSVRAQNVDGAWYVIENVSGLLSRALQHEIDHMNGIMIVDHVSSLQKKMLSGKLKKLIKTSRDNSEVS